MMIQPRVKKEEMKEPTSRERYLSAFRHEEPDRVPIDLLTSESLRLPGVPQRPTLEERLSGVSRLGGDPVVDIWLPPETPHPDVKVTKGVAGRDAQGRNLLFAQWETPAGTIREVVTETDDWRDPVLHQHLEHKTLGDAYRDDWEVELFDDFNCSRFIEPPIKSLQDVEALRFILQLPAGGALERWREEAQEAKRIAGQKGLLLRARRTFAAEAGLWFMKTEDYLAATILDPDLVQAIIDAVAEWQMRRVEAVLDLGIDVLMHRGWYETPDYFGGDRYLKFCKPFIEKLKRSCVQAGVQLTYQRTKGNTQELKILKHLPVDHLWGVEPGPGMEDMAALKREVGGAMTLWGGVDTTFTGNQGTVKQIDAAVREAIETCAPGGGYVIMPIAFLFGSTPVEKAMAAIEAAKKYGRY
jgi:hypothetical protein